MLEVEHSLSLSYLLMLQKHMVEATKFWTAIDLSPHILKEVSDKITVLAYTVGNLPDMGLQLAISLIFT